MKQKLEKIKQELRRHIGLAEKATAGPWSTLYDALSTHDTSGYVKADVLREAREALVMTRGSYELAGIKPEENPTLQSVLSALARIDAELEGKSEYAQQILK